MNASSLLRRAARSFATAAFPLSTVILLVGTGTAAQAAPACEAPQYSPVQHRIVDKAAQGRDALIHFVSFTKPIYQLDLMETVAWLDQARASQAACVTTLSHASGER
jgi:hypothetical protein